MRHPLKDIIKSATDILARENIADAATDVWLLAEFILKINKQNYYLNPAMEIDEDKYSEYMAAVEKRSRHIPLQHITGNQEFMGLDFKVNEHVLVPRQDTEVLVLKTMEMVESLSLKRKTDLKIQPKNAEKIRILDMCTGSGCIAISLAKLCENVSVTAVDLSEEALQVAKENARLNEAEVRFVKSDLFAEINETFDIIVSNPPYIPTHIIEELDAEVKDHEPRMALDGDADGLKFYRIISEAAKDYLCHNGALLFEIGYDQGEDVSSLLDRTFNYVTVYKDLAGLDRVVVARN